MKVKDAINQVLKESPKQLEQHLSGRRDFFGFFLGKAMKLLRKSQCKSAGSVLFSYLYPNSDKNDM